MRFHIFVVAFLFCIINTKGSFGLSVPNAEIQDADIIERILKEYDGRFSTSEIWQNVKDGLSAAWETIVKANEEIIDKIEIMIYSLRPKGDEFLEKAKEHLKEIIERLKTQMNKIASRSEEMAELVMKCYQPHEQEIEDIVPVALDQIRKCMFTSISNRDSELERVVSSTAVNESVFLGNVTSKFDSCANDKENLNQCLTNVNDYISDQIAFKDSIVSKKENAAKLMIYNILDKMLLCNTMGVTNASGKIYGKENDIMKCVDQKDKDI